MPRKPASRRPLAPAAPPKRESLAHPLTFFLTSGERARVLKVLRAYHRARATALLRLIDGRRRPSR